MEDMRDFKVSVKTVTTLDGKMHEQQEMLDAEGLLVVAAYDDRCNAAIVGQFSSLHMAGCIVDVFADLKNGIHALKLAIKMHEAKQGGAGISDEAKKDMLKTLLGALD